MEQNLFDLAIFSILSSYIPLDFQRKIWVVPLKYFLAGKNAKSFWNIPVEKHFAPLKVLHPFIKFLVGTFVDIASTYSDSSFNSFSTSTCFVLFEVIFYLNVLVYHQNLSFLEN